MTTHDGTAALSNRRGFIALSQHAFGLCKRHKNNAALIYLDLEDQGSTENRPAQMFAKLLSNNFRASDVVGQLAENEFAVFLTNADGVSANISLERFAKRVAEYNESLKQPAPLTYRAGIERVDFDHHHNIDDLLAQSNSNLYQHRRARKHRPQT